MLSARIGLGFVVAHVSGAKDCSANEQNENYSNIFRLIKCFSVSLLLVGVKRICWRAHSYAGRVKGEYLFRPPAIKRRKATTDRRVAEKPMDRATGAHYFQQKEVKLKSVKYDPKTFKKVSEEERGDLVTLEMTVPSFA